MRYPVHMVLGIYNFVYAIQFALRCRLARSLNRTVCKDDFMFNPKRCGLFGLLDMRGGLIQSILEKRTVTPPNFILEQQTESHMKAEVFS